jgi:Protein of unknown function (DUF707)
MALAKSLYFSPVGQAGKEFLARARQLFPRQLFDFLIVSFDDTDFSDLGPGLEVIKDRGQKWRLVKKHLTPERVRPYEYVFIWDDDLDPAGFDPLKFLHIARRNQLDLVQPALSADSYSFHPITVRGAQPIGRETNFVEIMCPVYASRIWPQIYPFIDPDLNEWGWGYDLIPIGKKGIVDCMSVRHTRPGRSGNLGAQEQYTAWCERYGVSRPAFCELAPLA